MNVSLFKMALERVEISDWQAFEELCSSFLMAEFTDLRTMASSSGDGGRDAELYSQPNKPLVVAQYSIASNWKTKIKKTIDRLNTTFPDVRILIFMSNRDIGAQADKLKAEAVENGLSLDVRDKNWFLERANTDDTRKNASEKLIDKIARPYLEGEEIINKRSSPLSSGESKAALLYLGLQWQDDISGKGLTKLSFDALVRAALRHTDSINRMNRSEIHDRIASAITSNDDKKFHRYIDAALSRLTKRFIRHWKEEDEFCLTHDESQRIMERLADIESEENKFLESVTSNCALWLSELSEANETDLKDLEDRIPRIFERIFLKKGETFVSSVLSDRVTRIESKDLKDIIINDISIKNPKSKIVEYYPGIIENIIKSLISNNDKYTQLYLTRLSNSYTLLSFLNQTSDVQRATKKLFSHGKVWLDTSVILPVFAEQLEADESRKKITRLMKACLKAGVEFKITDGVIQEVNSHMNLSEKCSNYTPGFWQGRTPFLYYQYLHSGRPSTEFSKWISLFRGKERPDDDIAQYLNEFFEIERINLLDELQNVDEDLRWAIDRLWTEAHEKRRKQYQQLDTETTRILIKHDIETYLGVIALRKKESVSELGYRHWLCTLDKLAWGIRDSLRDEFPDNRPTSPLLSLSFLLNNMTFGPSRRLSEKSDNLAIPLILDLEMSDSVPINIIEIANDVRSEYDGNPEYVISRKVRDAIDRARRQKGCLNIPDEDEAEFCEMTED